MNYQFYAKIDSKEHGVVLSPYSKVFSTIDAAIVWKSKHLTMIEGKLKTDRELVLGEAIEEKEEEPVNTVFIDIKDSNKTKNIVESIHSIYYEDN